MSTTPRRWGWFLALVGLLSQGCSTDCEKFYSEYDACGFGAVSDADIDTCNSATEASQGCEVAYTRLLICIDGLDDPCAYPDACAADIELAGLECYP